MDYSAIDLVGQQLNQWCIVRRLGAGGFGTIWEARHHAIADLRVALKVGVDRGTPADQARLLREARMLSRVDDAHVVKVRDFGLTDDGLVYLAMDRLEGQNLNQYLRERGPLPWREARPLLLQILRATRAIHRVGIVHRDIKPSNCIIDEQGRAPRVRLIDFGLARPVVDSEDPVTHDGSVTGTYEFMAPECFVSPHRVDARADLYAIGILMFRMLVGWLPFRAPTRELVPALQVLHPPPQACRWRPSIPEAAGRIISRTLAKDPALRHQDATALLDAIESVPADAAASNPHAAIATADTMPGGLWCGGLVLPEPAPSHGLPLRPDHTHETTELSDARSLRSVPTRSERRPSGSRRIALDRASYGTAPWRPSPSPQWR